ncbi:Membrane protein insertase YidC [Buchnera aphidicola (Cinara splendens)]|uniref:Membrane protein insertase YidC, partial n=2 Tax=Buchnera aphidicola TaxID=9 RepID=A0A451DDQ1_9GAMM|nr:Membrane protein insertase YidC [Buchnera aphidicola (Cinara splendens)]
MMQRKFLTIWISHIYNQFVIFVNKVNSSITLIKLLSKIYHFQFYYLYKLFSNAWLSTIVKNVVLFFSKNLQFITKYAKLNIISYPIFRLLVFFYGFFHNWGITIIFVTILVKIIMYPLTRLQYVSTLHMKALQPEIQKIKNQFCNDSRVINKKILSLYKFKKINPFFSFLSIMLQIPIFLSFYYVLVSSVELKNAPFIFWITDLSSYDPYYVLPICVILSILLTQYHELSYNNIIKKKNFLCIMPFLCTFFLFWLPSGLILYYITSNLMTFLQQWIIRRNFFKNNKYN